MNREEKIRWFTVGFIIATIIDIFIFTCVPIVRSPGPDHASFLLPQEPTFGSSGPLIDTNKCLKCHTLLLPYDTEITNTKL